MEDKNILIDTLKSLLGDLQREKFTLRAIRKEKGRLSLQEDASIKKINEIRCRIDYNMNRHGKLLK